jgi:hypothetical protein
MSLTLFIALAVVIPLVVFGALYLFTRGMVWSARRPRAWAVTMMIFGPLYAASGLWETRGELNLGNGLLLITGASFFALGVYHWFRAKPIDLE